MLWCCFFVIFQSMKIIEGYIELHCNLIIPPDINCFDKL